MTPDIGTASAFWMVLVQTGNGLAPDTVIAWSPVQSGMSVKAAADMELAVAATEALVMLLVQKGTPPSAPLVNTDPDAHLGSASKEVAPVAPRGPGRPVLPGCPCGPVNPRGPTAPGVATTGAQVGGASVFSS